MSIKPTHINFGRTTIPIDQFATQGNAVLGIRESGKSYTATYCAESLMEFGVPIIGLDPIGIWRFLRVAAKGAGFPVVVCGGEHGDIPLTAESAESITRAAMKSGVSVIFDMYDITMSKRVWRDVVTAVCKTLLYENKAYGPRHIFIEEAAEFAPQRLAPDQGLVYSYIERLVRMGGNAQLGVTLINQRAEELNKAVLDLCDCLILHRQKGRNSLLNLSKWFDAAGINSVDAKACVPILKNGEALVWASESAGPVRTQIPQKRTFHPDRRARQTNELAEQKRMDVGDFVKLMKVELAKSATEVTAALPGGGEVRVPAANVRRSPNIEVAAESFTTSLKEEHRRGVAEGEMMGMSEGYMLAGMKVDEKVRAIAATQAQLDQQVRELLAEVEKMKAGDSPLPAKWGTSIAAHPVVKRAQRGANMQARDFVEGVRAPDRAVLTPLAQFGRPMDKDEVAVLAGYRPDTGHFNNIIGSLRKRGWVTLEWPLAITAEGMKALGPFDAIPAAGAERVEWIKGRLKRPERVVFETAVKAYPGTLTKAQLAKQSGYEPSAGHFTNVLGRLRTMKLLKGRHDIKASEALFQ